MLSERIQCRKVVLVGSPVLKWMWKSRWVLRASREIVRNCDSHRLKSRGENILLLSIRMSIAHLAACRETWNCEHIKTTDDSFKQHIVSHTITVRGGTLMSYILLVHLYIYILAVFAYYAHSHMHIAHTNTLLHHASESIDCLFIYRFSSLIWTILRCPPEIILINWKIKQFIRFIYIYIFYSILVYIYIYTCITQCRLCMRVHTSNRFLRC